MSTVKLIMQRVLDATNVDVKVRTSFRALGVLDQVYLCNKDAEAADMGMDQAFLDRQITSFAGKERGTQERGSFSTHPRSRNMFFAIAFNVLMSKLYKTLEYAMGR